VRLDALYLKAFGPFTDRELPLGDGQYGVHVIYGPNEAGKSSALRAVCALLFGVPERTVDSFVHDNQSLRVGARVCPGEGAPFTCFRRKGRKDTLLDASGKPMDESVLAALLQGVDEARFSTLFGIDHDSLVAGGRSLLAEHGREAEALFGSGLGSAVVHQVLEELDRQAQELFAPRAQRPAINALLRELDEVRAQAREATLSATRWDEARREQDRTRAALERAEQALREAQARRAALERLRRTLPGLARLAEQERRLRELGEAPGLAADFAARRHQALEALRVNREIVEQAATRLVSLDEQMRETRVDNAVLDEVAAIDALHARLGQRRQAMAERPALQARREHAAKALDERLAALSLLGMRAGLDRRALSARLAHRARAEALARQHEGLDERVRGLERRAARCEEMRERCRAAIEALPVAVASADLASVVKAARALGEVDVHEAGLARRRDAAERDCTNALTALGRWAGSADALLEAAVPDDTVLREFQDRFHSLADHERQHHARELALNEQISHAREALRALELAGPVPTEAELASARVNRERGWALVKRQWLDAGAARAELAAFSGGDASDAALARTVEAVTRAADELADRLRREAQRVHERAASLARVESCEAQLAALALEQRAAQRSRAALEQQWRAAWSAAGVEPGTVGEMIAWLQSALRLREQLRALHATRAEHGDLCSRRAAVCDRLRQALAGVCPADRSGVAGSAGEAALAPLLVRAESRLESLHEQQRRRHDLGEEARRLEDEQAGITADLADASAARNGWAESWETLSKDLGLTRPPEPAELAAHFDGLQAAATLAEQLATASESLNAMDADSSGFAAEAAALCRRMAPDLAAHPGEEIAARLHARLREQQQMHTRLGLLRKQADVAREERDRARAAVRSAEQALDSLCREAGGVQRDALEELEQRDREHRELIGALAAVRSELLSQGDGASVEELGAAARCVERDAVAGELQHVERVIADTLEPERKARAEACYAAQRDFEQLGGGAGAAELEASASQLVAAIREPAARFVRLRLAARVLREQIDRYRKLHRDPIVAAAGRYFRTLTAGGYDSVDTDFDVGDDPVLMAVRADGEQLRVEALSTGTRDQLYLALRLAALDHYLERTEPLPFVVDDILVQFDDARTRATLKALAHFSRRTQVLLFTHHARVAQDARKLAGEGGGVFVHAL